MLFEEKSTMLFLFTIFCLPAMKTLLYFQLVDAFKENKAFWKLISLHKKRFFFINEIFSSFYEYICERKQVLKKMWRKNLKENHTILLEKDLLWTITSNTQRCEEEQLYYS